jgi:two-component system cell cycle sensor histidine kinase/response regulator CckA
VLLVEDDERVRQLVNQILASGGLRVIEAADGVAARRIAEGYEGRIDLLLSDIVMPGGLNGVQLAAQMRAAIPPIKVLLMSGYTDDALAATGELGADTHFIQKPFTPALLMAKIAEALAAPDDTLLQRRA